MLSKEDILAAQDIRTQVVNVPEWGGDVTIAEMSGTARDTYERLLFTKVGDSADIRDLRAKLVAFSIVDEEGNLMFTAGEVAELGKKSARALTHVFEAASELNAIGVEGLDEAAGN